MPTLESPVATPAARAVDDADPRQGSPFADLALVGVNHRTVELSELARFGRDTAARAQAARALSALGLREFLILATCNRAEVLYVHDGSLPARLHARAILGALCQGDAAVGRERAMRADPPPHVSLDATAAVQHLFEVGASLDSLVVGEHQIVRQLREAAAEAEALGTLGPRLRGLTSEAFRVARRVRREAGLAPGACALTLAASRVLRRAAEAPSLPVAIVGAGAMGEQAAASLQKRLAGPLLFVNRTLAGAARLGERFGGRAISLDAFLTHPEAVAAVVTATSAPRIVFGAAAAEALLRARRHAGVATPLLFVDLAVPFDVDPRLREIDGIDVVNLDSLRSEAERRAASQSGAVARARALVESAVERLAERELRRDEARAFARARSRAEDAAREVALRLADRLAVKGARSRAAFERWAVEASHRAAHALARGDESLRASFPRLEWSRFVRATGGASTVDEHRASFDAALESITRAFQGGTPPRSRHSFP